MLVSTKGRYALRVMIDLADQSKDAYIPLKDIAKRENISEKYLENILPVLVRNDFISGLRGKGGGYRLTRSPETYTVGSILTLVEGSISPVSCVGDNAKPCSRSSECPTLPMWQDLQDKIDEFFGGITLADLCVDQLHGNDFVI